MIDIHSHILWGLDDGSQSLEMSVAMLRAAASAGTTDIVATPHSNSRYVFDPALIAQRINELQTAGESLPRIHSGCDFHLSFDNVQAALETPEQFTIDHKNYLLVEFSNAGIPSGMENVFGQFLKRGVVPIVTHPERNALLMRDVPQLSRWVEQGCMMQVTAMSLTGAFGGAAQTCAWELMERRLVHVVASDAHDPVRRHPRLDKARAEVARRAGEENAVRLFETNPRAAMEGRPPDQVEQMTAPPKRRWFGF